MINFGVIKTLTVIISLLIVFGSIVLYVKLSKEELSKKTKMVMYIVLGTFIILAAGLTFYVFSFSNNCQTTINHSKDIYEKELEEYKTELEKLQEDYSELESKHSSLNNKYENLQDDFAKEKELRLEGLEKYSDLLEKENKELMEENNKLKGRN